jgi:hypothetical protein
VIAGVVVVLFECAWRVGVGAGRWVDMHWPDIDIDIDTDILDWLLARGCQGDPRSGPVAANVNTRRVSSGSAPAQLPVQEVFAFMAAAEPAGARSGVLGHIRQQLPLPHTAPRS